LRQHADPAACETAFVNREETEQCQQADDGQHHTEDVHFALGRNAAQDRETFGRDSTLGGGTPPLWGRCRLVGLRGSPGSSTGRGTAHRLRFRVRSSAAAGAGGGFFERGFRAGNWHMILSNGYAVTG
jgi:hypothetical protein